MNAPFQEGYATVRVIEINPDRTQTTQKLVNAGESRKDLLGKQRMSSGYGGGTSWEERKYRLWISYRLLLEKGTVATTYFHDHHNLFVAGSSPDDMLFAVNRDPGTAGGISDSKRWEGSFLNLHFRYVGFYPKNQSGRMALH